jgi:hypothetical protein
MMKCAWLALATLATIAGSAAAQQGPKLPPFRAAAYPIDIRKALSYGPDECRRQGGGKVTFAADTVRRIDLNDDGRDDYIITFEDTKCAGRESVYCGTGGCTLDIHVTLPNGKQRMIFSDRVRAYEILPGEGARTIRFDMHGSFCGTYGAAECPKEQRISDKPFAFKEPKS